jgi:tRNA pseudouridine55 synthase
MHGFLNLDKPVGITSRTAVDRVARLVKPAKAGHAGTLDPLASGVLVVAVGSATRLIEYVQQMPKSYSGTFLLGQSSASEDVEGEVTLHPNAPQPTLAELQAAGAKFLGETLQRPPAFSALKVNGKRAYELARKGKTVDLEPRPITVTRLDVLFYSYPELVIDIECSGGTYVRSLGRDLAESVGTTAVMSALVRTGIGKFTLETAAHYDKITHETLPGLLLPPAHALSHLPTLELTAAEIEEITNGRYIRRDAPPIAGELVALDATGRLVAILTYVSDGALKPVRVFLAD